MRAQEIHLVETDHASLGAALACQAGCAGIDHKPLTAKKGTVGKRVGGIPYYEPAIYLLGYSDANGGVKVEVKVMPDQTRKMVAHPVNFWSKVSTTMTFADGKGILATQDSTIDASEVAEGMAKVLKEAAKTVASLVALGQTKPGQVPPPSLFKLVREAKTASKIRKLASARHR